jgi:hypothetical protein
MPVRLYDLCACTVILSLHTHSSGDATLTSLRVEDTAARNDTVSTGPLSGLEVKGTASDNSGTWPQWPDTTQADRVANPSGFQQTLPT